MRKPDIPARALRRHHENRMKRRVEKHYSEHAPRSARATGKRAQTRQPCSCWMCGNPRRHFGERTLQERRNSWRPAAERPDLAPEQTS